MLLKLSKIITLSFFLSIISILFFPKNSQATGPNVFYGGFAFTGKAIDIEKNFKYSNQLNNSKNGSLGELDSIFMDLFKRRANQIKEFNLRFTKSDQNNANSETLVMTLAVTREDFYTESLSDCTKAVLNLFLRVVFIDMTTKTVLNSYPLHLEIIDVLRQKPDDTRKIQMLKAAYSGSEGSQYSITSIIMEDLPTYRVASANAKNFQVRKVTIENSAAEALFDDKSEHFVDAYADSIAQRFSDELSRVAKVSVLPSGRDALNGKCSLVFADGKEQDFKIPEASYGIDLTLQDLQTKNLDANNVEKAIAFGAFMNVRVYEPEYNTEFFQKKVIHGSAKKFSLTTKDYDIQGIYKEVVQLTLKKSVTEMYKDSKLKKGVIDKCINF